MAETFSSGPVRITVYTDGLDNIRKAFETGSPVLTKGFRKAAFHLLDFWHQRFESGGGGNWPALLPDSQRKKAKAGYDPSAILIASRQLIDALDPSIPNARGRTLVISRKGMSFTIGYGGRDKYQTEDVRWTKAFGYGGGTIAALADLMQTPVGNRPARQIIVDPRQSTNNKVVKTIQEAVNKVVDNENKKGPK